MSEMIIETVGTVKVYLDNNAIVWCAGLAVDADGSPHAYAPAKSGLRGLDFLANAGKLGNWFGLVCDSNGIPIVQNLHDPAPGYFVSATALVDHSKVASDPRRYVDSEQVPYISVSPALFKHNVNKGDLAFVYCRTTKKSSPAIVADVGPRKRLGEGSIALASALGLNPSPKNGGTSHDVVYVVFSDTATTPPWPRNDVALQAQQHFDRWGGFTKLLSMEF